MPLQEQVRANFTYPDNAIPLLPYQDLDEPSPGLVILPPSAIGFEFVMRYTTEVESASGERVQFVQERCLGLHYIVGYAYGRDDVIGLDNSSTSESIIAFMNEFETDTVVLTPGGLWCDAEEYTEVIEPSQLRQRSFEGMPSID